MIFRVESLCFGDFQVQINWNRWLCTSPENSKPRAAMKKLRLVAFVGECNKLTS
jgi:hypothetical protein